MMPIQPTTVPLATALPWDVPSPFLLPVKVGPEHIDGFGHTNNVVYLQFLEQVAWAHSQALGLGMDAYRRLNTGCVARRHELDYLAPSFAGEDLWLATWIHENDGRLSMWRRFQIIRAHDQKTLMRAATHWVCVDLTTGRPKRQPPEFLSAYCAGRGAVA